MRAMLKLREGVQEGRALLKLREGVERESHVEVEGRG